MRAFKQHCVWGVLLISVLYASAFQAQQPEKTEAQPEFSRLLRMELLVFPKKKPERSHRNIFTVKKNSEQEAQLGNTAENRSDRGGEEAVQPAESPLPVFYIRYIGYVKSGGKITALIVFEGEALAVEEGEMIASGLQVQMITTEEIGVIGPDLELRTFPLEGDRP